MSPKVYFVGGAYMGCWYVRCFLPMMYNGWRGNYNGLSKQLKPVKIVEEEMRQADIVVFHRADTNWHHRIAIELKKMGKLVVFDNDDTVKLDDHHPFFNLDDKGFKANLEKINNVINNFVRNCDLVTCSTEYLAKEYRELNPNVVVLPNYVNPDDWSEPLRNETDKVRIGLVGSTAYNHDFEHIKDLLVELDKDPRVQLVLYGLIKNKKENPLVAKTYKKEYKFWETLKNLEHAPWCEMVDYFDTLNELRLDMMLIPRRENHFNKAKSNVKFLEASMLEIPVIAQGFTDHTSPYDADLDGNNGILITDNSQWQKAVYDLIENPDKRRAIGKAAKEYVLTNYNIADHSEKWADIYQTLYEKNHNH